MAYHIVKYIICAEFWGTNIIAVPLSTNSGDVSPRPPVIYAHGLSRKPLLDLLCSLWYGLLSDNVNSALYAVWYRYGKTSISFRAE